MILEDTPVKSPKNVCFQSKMRGFASTVHCRGRRSPLLRHCRVPWSFTIDLRKKNNNERAKSLLTDVTRLNFFEVAHAAFFSNY